MSLSSFSLRWLSKARSRLFVLFIAAIITARAEFAHAEEPPGAGVLIRHHDLDYIEVDEQQIRDLLTRSIAVVLTDKLTASYDPIMGYTRAADRVRSLRQSFDEEDCIWIRTLNDLLCVKSRTLELKKLADPNIAWLATFAVSKMFVKQQNTSAAFN